MASIQRVVSPHTGQVAYRVQVRRKGRPPEFASFPNRKEAVAWAESLEAAIREGRHFPHAAAKRTSFDALAKDYIETVLAEFDPKEKTTRVRQLTWWSTQFSGLSLAEITADRISKARDKLLTEPFTRGKPHKDKKTGELIAPTQYKRSGATVNRFIATLSHTFSFAVKERRLMERNPVSDISRKKEPRGRTRFLSDDERTALLDACAKSEWPALHALVLLAITTGARKGELITLKWADVGLKTGRALVRETKNDEQRTLPLAGKALDALRELKLHNSARSEYVFAQPSGLPGPYEHFDAHWYVALEAAGISDFHFHDLRHTTASMLAAQGASLLEIADVLGHKTLAMVKRYSHLVVDHKAKVIEKMIAAKGL
ncbi:MAG TPA: site-specific integrase [Steroidobacteraceae bacterium]|nr:site-specific integrase [Steroidobacteraceae bacterium]